MAEKSSTGASASASAKTPASQTSPEPIVRTLDLDKCEVCGRNALDGVCAHCGFEPSRVYDDRRG